jgi:hypothetical protein
MCVEGLFALPFLNEGQNGRIIDSLVQLIEKAARLFVRFLTSCLASSDKRSTLSAWT